MKSKFAQIAMALAVLASMMVAGCSEKKEEIQKVMTEQISEEPVIRSDGSENVLENGNKNAKKLLADPELRTGGCLDGCKGLPCDEKVRCAQRNCPGIKIRCEL